MAGIEAQRRAIVECVVPGQLAVAFDLLWRLAATPQTRTLTHGTGWLA